MGERNAFFEGKTSCFTLKETGGGNLNINAH